MKDRFNGQIDLQIHLTNSDEAKKYQLRGSTTVFLDNEWVPLDVAISEERMAGHLVAQGVRDQQKADMAVEVN